MKILLFDFDGTLVNSMPAWSKKMINILEKTNTPYPPDLIKKIAPLGDVGTAKYFREELGVKLSEAEMFSLMDEYALPEYRDNIHAKTGVAEFLHYAKAKGCSLNVLTASPHKMLDVCLQRLGFFTLFDNVWSSDDFGTTKSDVKIYKAVAEKLGTETKNIVFFDDNVTAIKTAATAGLATVGVYDSTGEDFYEEMIKAANRYIHSFDELIPKESLI